MRPAIQSEVTMTLKPAIQTLAPSKWVPRNWGAARARVRAGQGARAPAATNPDTEECHGEDHGRGNGEAVQQHDTGDVCILVRLHHEVIGLHVQHGQQRVAPPGNLAWPGR